MTADAKPLKPSALSGAEADAAARDRTGLTRMLQAGNARRATEEPP